MNQFFPLGRDLLLVRDARPLAVEEAMNWYCEKHL